MQQQHTLKPRGLRQHKIVTYRYKFHLELRKMDGLKKLERWRNQAENKSNDICSRLENSTREWQTDGQTDTSRQLVPRLRIASRNKNYKWSTWLLKHISRRVKRGTTKSTGLHKAGAERRIRRLFGSPCKAAEKKSVAV